MIRITLKRIFRLGYLNFRRNGWLSMATILVLVLVLFVLGNLIFISAFANQAINTIQSKIDVTVYFNSDAQEPDILAVKNDLQTLSEVSAVNYVSKDEALAKFKVIHKNDALISSALDEIGANPLLASINITAKDPSKYAAISNFLVNKNYSIVNKIDYFDNQAVIDHLSSVISTVKLSGAVLEFILAFIAILVAFNTIRLAIYTMREEIRIMHLVGASSWFIRGPFLVTGVLYGIAATGVSLILFFPLTWAISPKISILLPEFNIFHYFLANFFEFTLILLIAGITLGTVSSFIAVRRYLEE